jgi:dihydrofolate reductase
MGDLIYGMGVSLDGYVEDTKGNFAWSAPEDDVHRLANQQAQEASAFVYGRRMFETLDEYWMRVAQEKGNPPIEAEFAAAYAATPRYVVSDTMKEASNGATLVPRAEARSLVERLKKESETHIDVGGPELAASLIDLIDEFRMWINPVAVGGGKPFFPAGKQLNLKLVESRPFPSGTLWLRYRRR